MLKECEAIDKEQVEEEEEDEEEIAQGNMNRFVDHTNR